MLHTRKQVKYPDFPRNYKTSSENNVATMPYQVVHSICCAASLNQGITASVDRVKAIIDEVIKNFDFDSLLELAKRSLDWHTYIDLAPSPRSQDASDTGQPQGGICKARRYIDRGVNILFEINEQYVPASAPSLALRSHSAKSFVAQVHVVSLTPWYLSSLRVQIPCRVKVTCCHMLHVGASGYRVDFVDYSGVGYDMVN